MSDSKKTIFLVEDDDIVVDLLVRRLKKSGYAVEVAPNGRVGLEMIQQKKPDLVLLDMLLPELDGFGVIEGLEKMKLLPDLPVIIISNSGQPIEIERAMKKGIRDYLIKINFNPDEVLEKIKEVLK